MLVRPILMAEAHSFPPTATSGQRLGELKVYIPSTLFASSPFDDSLDC